MKNYFSLFQLPIQFDISLDALESAYHAVQHQAHPDRFAVATTVEKRVALQWATQANAAYETLKDPFKRAIYLCECQGVSLQKESNTVMPADFLMQQMRWREALEIGLVTKDVAALKVLTHELQSLREENLATIAYLLRKENYPEAAHTLRQCRFIEKLVEDVRQGLNDIE